MKGHWKKLSKKYKILFCISLIGLFHFILSIFAWGIAIVFILIMQYRGDEVYWSFLGPSIIAISLFSLFLISSLMAWKSRKTAFLLLFISFLVATACFAYEAKNEKWQIQMMTKEGCKHTYYNWLLYDGPN